MSQGTGRRTRASVQRARAASDGGAARAARPRPVPPEPTFRQRVRYRVDSAFARGTPALVGLLGIASLALILVFTLVVLFARLGPKDDSGHRHGFIGQLFLDVQHAIDTGTIAGDTGHWPFLVAMLLLTVGGLFIVSALIGVIATGLDTRLQDLRKGRSFVVEQDHTLVLGWSESVFTILSELAVANASRKKPAVVILAERDKVEMEDAIREKVPALNGTRVICRTGTPIDGNDLAIANPGGARSIIVLGPEDDTEPDAHVIKTVLALRSRQFSLAIQARRNENGGSHPAGGAQEGFHIVAEVADPANLETAELVGGEETVLVERRDTIARLIVQTTRQSGAAAVYTELLDFEGEEIYFRADPALVGRTYGDALLAYEDCAVLGVEAADGSITLNPPPDRAIAEGERVIAVAEDDSALENASARAAEVEEDAIVTGTRGPEAARRILLLGWNERSLTVIRELDEFVAPGSRLLAIGAYGDAESDVAAGLGELANLHVEARTGSTTTRAALAALDVPSYDHVIVMAYSAHLDAQRADARTLVTLLHLRDIASRTDKKVTIASEMLDDRNRALAQIAQVDDVIVSDRVLSLILTQLSENGALRGVFDELFTAEGSEVYLRPVEEYVAPGREVTFATIVESARRRSESAFGLRFAASASDPHAAYGVRLNLPKAERITPSPGDRVVVLAEE